MSQFRLEGKLHIVYILKYIRYGIFLSLLPLLRVLLSWDLQALLLALWQDAAILLGMLVLAIAIWRQSSFRLEEDAFVLCQGLFFRRKITVRTSQLAAVVLHRPLYLRVLGGTRVELHSATCQPRVVQCHLSKRHAALLTEVLMPVEQDAVLYAPSGAERVRFTMLSANILTTAALVLFSARQTEKILGEDVGQLLGQLALDNLNRLEQLAELILPAGIAWVATLVFTLWGIALFFSLLSTSHFRVGRSGGIIHAKGGILNHSEQRIALAFLTYCDVRITPVARLMRCAPVYLQAGSYTTPLPLFMYKKGREGLLQALVPGFCEVKKKSQRLLDRSLPQFFWKGGVVFLLSIALWAVSVWKLPQWSMMLLIPVVLGVGLLAVSLEGWLWESIFQLSAGVTCACYTKAFTRHECCILTQDFCLQTMQTPFTQQVARCNLTLFLPSGEKLLIRNLKQYEAHKIRLTG